MKSLTAVVALFVSASLTFAPRGVAPGQEPAPQKPNASEASQQPNRPSQPDALPKAPAADNDPKAIETVGRYLEAIGGTDNLKKIRDKVLRFTNKKFEPTAVTEMKMARFQKRDYKIREEWELPISLGDSDEPLRFLQVYDGDNAFVRAMGYVSPLTGKTLTVFLWDKAIDDAFLHWKEDGYTLRHLGDTEIEGRNAEIVEQISFAGNQRIRHYFTSDGLLLKKEWTEDLGRGLAKKEVFFADYLKISFSDNKENWVKLASVERVFEDGELSLEKNYTTITINGGLDDSIFLRPEGPAFEERPLGAQGATQSTSQPASQPIKKTLEKATTQPKGDG